VRGLAAGPSRTAGRASDQLPHGPGIRRGPIQPLLDPIAPLLFVCYFTAQIAANANPVTAICTRVF